MPKSTRKLPEGSIKIALTLVPGTDEYAAFLSIKNKYQDEKDRRRKANASNQLCKTDTGNCELVRGALLALDRVSQEELPEYIDSAWKPKGRHALISEIENPEKQTDSDTQLDGRATLLH